MTQMGAALVTLSFALMFMLPLFLCMGQLALIASRLLASISALQVKPGGTSEPGLQPGAAGPWPPERSAVHRGLYRGCRWGSVLGSKLYVLAGWNGVVTLAVVSGAIALAIRLAGECAPHRSRTPHIIKPASPERSGFPLPS
ncbi:hypothetical protein LNO81_09875 [Klebsiella variicola subsp. variicola]|nr:hypothetical protein [Klebsiella variicola subsp. variicola]